MLVFAYVNLHVRYVNVSLDHALRSTSSVKLRDSFADPTLAYTVRCLKPFKCVIIGHDRAVVLLTLLFFLSRIVRFIILILYYAAHRGLDPYLQTLATVY